MAIIKPKLPLRKFVNPPKHSAEVEIYQSGKEWRWRIVSHYNKKIIDASSEGFSTKAYCVANLKLVGLEIESYLKTIQ